MKKELRFKIKQIMLYIFMLSLMLIIVSCSSKNNQIINECDLLEEGVVQNQVYSNANCALVPTPVVSAAVSTNEDTTVNQPESKDDENVILSIENENESEAIENDFGVLIGDTHIHLNEWETNYNWADIIGDPISSDVRIIQGGDTLSGSYEKVNIYDGITLAFFAPPPMEGEELNYWLLSMKVTSEQYPSIRGIRVGQSVEALKAAYPDITIAKDGRVVEGETTLPKQYAYALSEEYSDLVFEIDDDTIQEIKVNFWIP